MNIWIVSEGEPLPIDGKDVRLRRMGQLCEILAELDHEVHWFSSDFHHYKKQTRTFESRKINIKNNYFIHLLKGNPYKSNVSYSRIKHHKKISQDFLYVADKLDKPDLILSTMAPLELSESVVEFADDSIPVVIDIRDLWPEIYREVVPSIFKPIIEIYIKYSKRKLAKILNKSTALISVTDKFLEYALEISKRERRNIDSVFFTSYSRKQFTNSDFNKDWGEVVSSNDFIITFIGNYGKQFELADVVDAAKSLINYPNIKFVFCGGGENYKKLQEDTENYDNIIIKDWINGGMINSLLNNTSIGIAPYRNSINFRYNIPNKFGEYLSYGVPILVSVKGEMEKLLNKYHAGFYYEDSHDLVNQIINIYNDNSLLKDMSNNSKKIYENYFDSNVVYTNLANYLIKVAQIYKK